MNEKIKINYNQKHRFFKFIILWLITFAFMFCCSMVIYAITVNVNDDNEPHTEESSMQIEIIDQSKTQLIHTNNKPEKSEVSIEISDTESLGEMENYNNVSEIEEQNTEELPIFEENGNQIEDEYAEESINEEPEAEYISLGEFRLTAYCPCEICCDECAYNRPVDEYGNTIVYTASGKIAQEGYTIAADPDVLPYGTIVYIDGHEYEVQDCGGAITNNSIDIYFDTHEAACEFGLQYGEVFIKNV